MSLALKALTDPEFLSGLYVDWQWEQKPEVVHEWEQIILGAAPLHSNRRIKFFADIYFAEVEELEQRYQFFFELVIKEAELLSQIIENRKEDLEAVEITWWSRPLIRRFWLEVFDRSPSCFRFIGPLQTVGFGTSVSYKNFSSSQLFDRRAFHTVMLHGISKGVLGIWEQSFVSALSSRSKNWATEHIRKHVLTRRKHGPYAAYEVPRGAERERVAHCWCPACKARGEKNQLSVQTNQACSSCGGLICAHGMCFQSCDFSRLEDAL